MLPLLITRQDTAKLLNISTRTLDRMNLPKVKLGSSTRYEIKDVEAYIAGQREEVIVASLKSPIINTRQAKLHKSKKSTNGSSFRDRMNAVIA